MPSTLSAQPLNLPRLHSRQSCTSVLRRLGPPLRPLPQQPRHDRLAARRPQLRLAVVALQAAVQLSEKESTAKEKFLQQLSGGQAAQQQAIALLTDAACHRKVAPELVIGALAVLEGSAQSQPDVLELLQGRWKLVFGSNGPPFALYIPVNEVTDIDVATGTIDLASDIGPLLFQFFGEFKWQAPATMDFAFSGSRVSIWQRQLSRKSRDAAKRKQYRFFHVNEGIAVVRSSVGGYILMLRLPKIEA